jgi:hypothetical protein
VKAAAHLCGNVSAQPLPRSALTKGGADGGRSDVSTMRIGPIQRVDGGRTLVAYEGEEAG